MINFKLTAPKDLTRQVDELRKKAQSNPVLMEAIGNSAEDVLKEHFTILNKRSNKRGWQKKNFWADIQDATAFEGSTGKSASVKIAHPAFAAKVYGGVIKPKKVKALPIPLTEIAYIKGSPKAWDKNELELIPRDGKPPLLAKVDGENTVFHYVLVKKVITPPEDDALPKTGRFWEAILEDIKAEFSKIEGLL